MLKRKVVCPFNCGKEVEITSISHFVYAHHCPVGGWWYSNGTIWANSLEELSLVPRTPQNEGSSVPDRQEPGKVVQAQFADRVQDQPNPA